MDAVRYLMALLIAAFLPAAVFYWMVIHPFAGFWRRLGPLKTHLIVGAGMVAVAATLIWFRASWLTVDFGTSWLLAAAGLAMYGLGIAIEVQCRRHLKLKTLIGMPELTEGSPGKLLCEGIYGRMRHPRYVSVSISMVGWGLVANYLASYVVLLVTLPMLHVVVLFEERELRARFGEEYARYAERVPRYIPRQRTEA